MRPQPRAAHAQAVRTQGPPFSFWISRTVTGWHEVSMWAILSCTELRPASAPRADQTWGDDLHAPCDARSGAAFAHWAARAAS